MTIAERELDGIWFLTTFLTFGYELNDERNPFKIEDISFISTDDGSGFSQVNIALENGQHWRIEVERVA